ncbi:Rim4p SCDLUD_001358 [Saccharomycodes ludwigii]|uniref:Rim4p n=1 Tax=Saccharomycodes ludwigii TaxID=36035 RepID=UPI001E85D10E|nr:hypothetical protein SCDLUD_001358 [Saccharomycodes ludwigii]KAH3901595.1 hypothetical protein SCDLUD_001358 [Saccharomycodes ludwigii]
MQYSTPFIPATVMRGSKAIPSSNKELRLKQKHTESCLSLLHSNLNTITNDITTNDVLTNRTGSEEEEEEEEEEGEKKGKTALKNIQTTYMENNKFAMSANKETMKKEVEANTGNVKVSRNPRSRPSSCIFVASLSSALTDDELCVSVTEMFNKFGHISLVKVLRDIENRPYAFVQYTNDEDAKKAIKFGHGSLLNGRNIRCEFARVNRTLYISNNTTFNQESLDSHGILKLMENFGEVEQLVSCNNENTGNNKKNNKLNGWFVQFAYRDDAIVAYARLKSNSFWNVDWAQNIEVPYYQNLVNKLKNKNGTHGSNYNTNISAVVCNGANDALLNIDRFSIFIGKLPFDITKQELYNRFSVHGEIVRINLNSKDDNKTKFAFIKYTSEKFAASALERENHATIKNKIMHVQYREIYKRKSSITHSRNNMNDNNNNNEYNKRFYNKNRSNTYSPFLNLAPPPVSVNNNNNNRNRRTSTGCINFSTGPRYPCNNQFLNGVPNNFLFNNNKEHGKYISTGNLVMLDKPNLMFNAFPGHQFLDGSYTNGNLINMNGMFPFANRPFENFTMPENLVNNGCNTFNKDHLESKTADGTEEEDEEEEEEEYDDDDNDDEQSDSGNSLQSSEATSFKRDDTEKRLNLFNPSTAVTFKPAINSSTDTTILPATPNYFYPYYYCAPAPRLINNDCISNETNSVLNEQIHTKKEPWLDELNDNYRYNGIDNNIIPPQQCFMYYACSPVVLPHNVGNMLPPAPPSTLPPVDFNVKGNFFSSSTSDISNNGINGTRNTGKNYDAFIPITDKSSREYLLPKFQSPIIPFYNKYYDTNKNNNEHIGITSEINTDNIERDETSPKFS